MASTFISEIGLWFFLSLFIFSILKYITYQINGLPDVSTFHISGLVMLYNVAENISHPCTLLRICFIIVVVAFETILASTFISEIGL